MKEIHSTKNTLIKELKKLEKKKYRKQQQQYLLEGFHLIEEAINAQAEIIYILLTPEVYKEKSFSWLEKIPEEQFLLVSAEVLKWLSAVPAPQGMIAVIKMPVVSPQEKWEKPLLLLDNVQDPGNVGTMIRTADAAGFQAVFLGN